MEEDRKLAKEDLYEERIAWLDVMTWGFFYASKEMQP
jgi:hypothetical protein